MRKTTNSSGSAIKILLALLLLVVTIILCSSRSSLTPATCVRMPAPEETVSEFFDALTDGRYEDCDALLSNYTSLGLTSSTDTVIGSQLFEMLGDSYHYDILDSSNVSHITPAAEVVSSADASAVIVYSSVTIDDINKALESTSVTGKDASVAVAFTYLDISSMSDDLHTLVTDIAYNYAYESIDINNEETANQVVLESLQQLNESIEDYYRTDIFIINMKYDNGEWKIILDEALYKAIIGNIA